jgi:membrane fusion protein, multidrug efflux system
MAPPVIEFRRTTTMRFSVKNFGLAAFGIGLAAIGFVLLDSSSHGAARAPAMSMPAMPVPVVPVVQRTVPVYLDFVGTTEAIRSITLEAEVTGYLDSQVVPDGADVHQDQLIYQIDPRSYQAALDQATAQTRHDAAALEYARVTDSRNDTLTKEGWVARETFDQTASALHEAQATLAADAAAIETAKLNLGWTEIRAPFAGRLGRSQVHEGSLITVAGTPLNTLVQLDPIYATFNPSETDLALLGKFQAGKTIPGEVTVPDDGDKRYEGKLTFLNNTVDGSTGTIVARATIANPDHTLLPGEFVHVRLHVADRPDTLLVPQVALGSSQFGKYVYVAADGKAEQRLVTTGATYGNFVVVAKGVSGHDAVIIGNLQKIAPGAPVRPIMARPPLFSAVSSDSDSG